MRRWLIVSVLVLSACGRSSASSDEWSDWPSGLRASIDAYAAEQDCAGLQGMFDSVDAADGSHPDILDYINGKLADAGCYG